MRTSHQLPRAFLAFAALLLLTSVGLAADPGLTYPTASEMSDQKAGSVLLYNVYSSIGANPSKQNTRFNITNTSTTSGAFVHLFFVEGGTCSVADRYICLTASQTMSFLASEQDPGTTGYMLAVSTDFLGCPNSFNWLIGDQFVKFESEHFANLGAETFTALYDHDALFGFPLSLPGCNENTIATIIVFNGLTTAMPLNVGLGGYSRVPRVLALDNIGSPGNGNNVRVWINRVGGDLFGGGGGTGTFFGILYDDAESPHSFQISAGTCQRAFELSDTNPKTVPRFSVVIPSGQTGWLKIWSTAANGITGAAINRNGAVATGAGAFNSGHNLHKTRLNTFDFYTIPVFPPGCSGPTPPKVVGE